MSTPITLNELLTSLTLFVQRSTFRYNSSPCSLQNIASRVASSAEENGGKSHDNLLSRGPNSTSVVRSFCHNQSFLTKELMLLLLSIY